MALHHPLSAHAGLARLPSTGPTSPRLASLPLSAPRLAPGRLAFITLAVLALSACAPLARAPEPAGRPAATGAAVGASTAVPLPAPGASRNWAQFKQQAAQRMMAASPGQTYTGAPPEVLLAVPVLEVELHADGSIRRIDVLRQPRQARDTVPMAIAAVRRGAPYGDVSRLPRPWRFTESFLFDDQRRFLVRTLAP